MRYTGILVALVLICFVGRQAAPAADPAKDDKPIVVKLEDIAKEFKDDSTGAAKKYRGKVLQVTGTVMGRGARSIKLKIKDGDQAVMSCSYATAGEEERTKFDNLKNGDEIIVQGELNAYVQGIVEFKNCKLVK